MICHPIRSKGSERTTTKIHPSQAGTFGYCVGSKDGQRLPNRVGSDNRDRLSPNPRNDLGMCDPRSCYAKVDRLHQVFKPRSVTLEGKRTPSLTCCRGQDLKMKVTWFQKIKISPSISSRRLDYQRNTRTRKPSTPSTRTSTKESGY